jgi:hypothetical protein
LTGAAGRSEEGRGPEYLPLSPPLVINTERPIAWPRVVNSCII